jgi:outer membrane beta-barrel protein
MKGKSRHMFGQLQTKLNRGKNAMQTKSIVKESRRINFSRGMATLLFIFSQFLTAERSIALELKPDQIRGKSNKNPVTVLQDRYFLKAFRPEVGLAMGSVLDEAYLSTSLYGVRAGMFINEWLGFEFQQFTSGVADSADRKALNQLKYRPRTADALPDGEEVLVSPDPEVNAIHKILDVNAVGAPFYGKMNFFNQFIIYTDIYITGGIAQVETDQGDKQSMTLGAGERFYVGKAWSLRVDFKNRIYNEKRAGKDTTKNAFTFDFGASYFFN